MSPLLKISKNNKKQKFINPGANNFIPQNQGGISQGNVNNGETFVYDSVAKASINNNQMPVNNYPTNNMNNYNNLNNQATLNNQVAQEKT